MLNKDNDVRERCERQVERSYNRLV